MKYIIEFSKKADFQFGQFENSVKKRIYSKLEWFINTGNPLKYSKKLTNSSIGTYRFRIGKYRILFDIDKKGNLTILYILSIKHRRQAYC